jgi:hypothetical protein
MKKNTVDVGRHIVIAEGRFAMGFQFQIHRISFRDSVFPEQLKQHFFPSFLTPL